MTQLKVGIYLPSFAYREDGIDHAERLRLWDHHLPADHEVDPAFLEAVASSCTLTGGQIRGAALNATLLALQDNAPVKRPHVQAALRREYRKSGGVYPLLDTEESS